MRRRMDVAPSGPSSRSCERLAYLNAGTDGPVPAAAVAAPRARRSSGRAETGG